MSARRARMMASVAMLAALALAAGCNTFSGPTTAATTAQAADETTEVLKNPVTAALPGKTADQLAREVLTNAGGFNSMRANCSVVFDTPLVVDPQGRPLRGFRLDGRMAVAFSRKLKMILSATQKTMVDITGDGTEYIVDMPGIGRTSYSGVYDSPLALGPQHLSMLPDDIAEAFDQNRLFAGKSLALKSYPDWWVIEGVRRHGDRIVAAASYDIRRETSSAEQDPAKIVTYTKFDARGDVRCIIRMADYRDAIDKDTGPRGVVCAIPHSVQITYPREGTTLLITVSGVELNPKDLDPGHFKVRRTTGPATPSTTRVLRRGDDSN